ncbi:MAG TPA: dTDP-4-amino-4,6-dideoxygalactose transaminase [Chitinophagaceae bacterium]|nr:dTDP-4-amino-4,6-dideoxygalactose transaminase [Chitinophagaceae bacterium]
MHPYSIPFNKPFLTGKEMHYMYQAVYSGHISGNGIYTKKCQAFFEEKYGAKKVLMTTSCTDALEMSAILSEIGPGDEVIVPSFTFVSTALAFVRQGAKIIFADSSSQNPNIDAGKIESLISKKTKAIVVVHYAGIACDMDLIMDLSERYKLLVIEDAAHSIDSYYKGNPLGCIGHLSCFSFHETKNLQCGEGGSLWIKGEELVHRAEIIWEKGTNRSDFAKGMVTKYEWVDTGSSFLPSEINSAYLYAQLEYLNEIQDKRKWIWSIYHSELHDWAEKNAVQLPKIPEYATNNAHMFYMVCASGVQRDSLINHLKGYGILAVSHYLSLHKSPFYISKYEGSPLINSDHFSDCIIRLPLYYELSETDLQRVIDTIKSFRP